MNRNKPKKNLGASIRQRLKNLSKERNQPFDEILRYYAIERFLYRLSISAYSDICYGIFFDIECVQESPVYPGRRELMLSRAKLSGSKAEWQR